MDLPVVSDKVRSKRVFVRGDIDVPLGQSTDYSLPTTAKILDDTRLKAIWPTIEYLLKHSCEVVLAGHLGRPGGKVDPNLSSRPVQDWFAAKTSSDPHLKVLENLRFDPREETNDLEYAKELAAMADVYVNEAFASCGGEHASIVGVPKLLPHYAGFRLAKEVEVLTNLVTNPKRPMLAIIGGAKLETKIPVISKMAEVADQVIVGGKLLVEYQVSSIKYQEKIKTLDLSADGKDCTLESIDNCKLVIDNSATIVWNGPVGMVEDPTYQVGTKRLAELIVANNNAYKVVGGGDSIGFLDKLGLTAKFDWASTGGGSMLKLLAGEKLPGLEALLT